MNINLIFFLIVWMWRGLGQSPKLPNGGRHFAVRYFKGRVSRRFISGAIQKVCKEKEASSGVLRCFVHVCFVQVTILKLVWCSRHADVPQCAHFPTDICSVIQEGEITEEKCMHRGASANQERHTLSRNKHGHN